MAKNNIMAIEAAFEGAYIRERETEDGGKFFLASEASFGTINWNIEASEKEDFYKVSNGEEEVLVKVEKQIHQKVNRTWKIEGEKFSDGTTIKINGRDNGKFEVFSNVDMVNGKHKMKRLGIFDKESEAMNFYKKALKDHKASLKTSEAKEA